MLHHKNEKKRPLEPNSFPPLPSSIHHVMIHVAKLFNENMVTVLISKVAFALSLAIKLQVHVSDQQCKIVIWYKSYYIATGKKKSSVLQNKGLQKKSKKFYLSIWRPLEPDPHPELCTLWKIRFLTGLSKACKCGKLVFSLFFIMIRPIANHTFTICRLLVLDNPSKFYL